MHRFLSIHKFKILDIGSGEGAFLYVLREMGIESFGVEPDILQAQYGIKRGLNIKCDYYRKESFENQMFDLITINRTLEHMPYPYAVFDCIRNHLKSKGFVLVDVPTYCDKKGNFKKIPFDTGHLRVYDADSLKWFLTKNNFKIIDLPSANFYPPFKPGIACLAQKADKIH